MIATMHVPFVDLKAQHRALAPEIETAVRGVFERGDFILGPAVEQFEAEYAALIGTRHACARLRGDECTIYVKPPRNEDDRAAIYILGHEALHCFVGHFHYAVN